MATQNSTVSFLGALSQASLYKRTQGRLVRQLTALTITVIVLLGARAFSSEVMRGVANSVAPSPTSAEELKNSSAPLIQGLLRYGVPTLLGLLGCWVAYRAVNYPRFADFLISVEAEINKVSWPSMGELKRGTIVVISVMFSLGITLTVYNSFWYWFFKFIGVLEDIGPSE